MRGRGQFVASFSKRHTCSQSLFTLSFLGPCNKVQRRISCLRRVTVAREDLNSYPYSELHEKSQERKSKKPKPTDPKLRHWRGQEMLYFKFSDKMTENRVVRAKLWLYLKPGDPDESGPITITVLKATSMDAPVLIPLSSIKESRPRGSGRWISLEVKRLVSEWFKNPKDNLGLVVQASVAGQESLHPQHLVVVSTQHEGSSYVPFLEVHITDSKKHRTKRTIGLNCPENSDEKRCCRYPLTVDFEEFGWDWIIAPKKYEANYCSGECPLVFLPKYPHTHIVHIANPTGTPGPCCAPRKMSSISMLYFDNESNIIYGLLPGMVVDRCGCA